MRLTSEQVGKISVLVMKGLKEKGLISFKSDEKTVLEKINGVILKNLRDEDDLDREVEEILKSHSGSIDSQKIDYRKMFSMIKGKLARERGIVL